ncbi:BTAD domain-containing putative transcriptional regulator [Lysinibacillus antri]|uniref:Transcriptional regulator n=1 Tax=Lysinibacillus antri TaxID=2498145 RepID=A0A432LEH6_9BACI|nr:BTAD domain-containing putative transcriptional regulator [Lysinibacillus antri]RUL55516.1 transcriptional regulator [Lysinibacillus antri]
MQNVLLSKLIPPDPSMYYMRRSKLLKKLSKSTSAKLTIVHSGAGFGKTSALSQLMADQRLPYSWYQVTEEDDDVLPFLRHLFYSIQRVYPQFGESIIGWDSFSMFPKIDELNKLYLYFVNEFCKVKEPMYVIIDDFHLVHHVFQINYILNKIMEFLPSHIHFIVATRSYPNWNCLLNLKMNGSLVECKEEEFTFSNEEIQILFEDYFGRQLSEEETDKIHQVTEGWAIAILLLAMQSNDSTLSIDEITSLSLQDFFSYLSEEVFENLSEIQQETLLKCSIFQTFSNEVVKEFYDEDFTHHLNELVQNKVFIQPLIGFQQFRFHALFHQFLEMKLRERSKEYYELHRKAAQYFAMKNEPINALYHAFKSLDETMICELFVQFASYFIEAGQYDYFLERLKELSEQTKERYYPLYFYEGECQRFRAQYEKAKKAYEKCLALATNEQDLFFVLKANTGIAHIYLDTIQPGLAESYLYEALKLSDSVQLKQDDLYLLQHQYAENLVNLGRAKEAENLVQTKKLPPSILSQGNLDVRIMLRQGKLFEAKRLINSKQGKEQLTTDAHRESDVLHALILTMMGDNEEALNCSTMSIKNSEMDHAQYVEAVAYLRKGHALMLLDPFNLHEAEKCYVKTNALMDEIHITRAKAESYMGLAMVKSKQGMNHEALSYTKLGLYETERVQDHWVSALLLTALTTIYIENNNLEKAKQSALKAQKLFLLSPDVYGEMVTNFWLAYIAFRQTTQDDFVNQFQKFLMACSEYNYYFFLTKRTLFGPENSLMVLQMLNYYMEYCEADAHYISQLLQYKKGDPIPKHYFTLHLFGPFTMFRNGVEVIDKEWKREKAKELFLYLYMNRHRFVAKEEIMHVLWPNGDEQAMNRDFKVVYNACLKVLEPQRQARDESAYIVRKQSMYQLHQKLAFTSDQEYFERFANIGLEQRDLHLGQDWLVRAVAYYKGDLLEDLQSFEWLQSKREDLHHLFILVVERIAQNFMRLKDFQKVIQWAEKLVRLDNTWEEGYRLLMLAYYHLENRPQAIKWYEKCVEVLEEELNIEPMETTVQVFEMIVR